MTKKAYCDTETGKIYGCEPYSKTWYHEKGHLEFARSETGSLLHYRQDSLLKMFLVTILGAIVWKPMVLVAGTCLLGYFGIELYEEEKCWEYADAIYSKHKSNEKS